MSTTRSPRRHARPRPSKRSLLRVAAALVIAGSTLAATAPATSAQAAPTAPAPTLCPAPAGNARFVRFVYLQILGRCPDARALSAYTTRLDRGLPRSSFTQLVDLSDENLVTNNVAPLYREILNRPPLAHEVTEGVAFIRRNRQDAGLVTRLFASDEYYAVLTGSPADRDRAWLDTVYTFVVETKPDPAGEDHWMRSFGTGSTETSRRRVIATLEHSRRNAVGWVQGVFQLGLRRAPSPGEQAYWVRWLTGPGRWRTFSLWTTVLASPEAFRLAQLQPNPFDPDAPSADPG